MRLSDRKIEFNQTFIVPKDETVSFDLVIAGQQLAIEIGFLDKSDNSTNPVSWVFANGKLRMTFVGIAPGVTPSLLKLPFRLGTFGGVQFGFLFSVHNIQDTHILHIVFLSGGTYDE
jgi:hypothetical protein